MRSIRKYAQKKSRSSHLVLKTLSNVWILTTERYRCQFWMLQRATNRWGMSVLIHADFSTSMRGYNITSQKTIKFIILQNNKHSILSSWLLNTRKSKFQRLVPQDYLRAFFCLFFINFCSSYLSKNLIKYHSSFLRITHTFWPFIIRKCILTFHIQSGVWNIL
jgi:hypothetical protein